MGLFCWPLNCLDCRTITSWWAPPVPSEPAPRALDAHQEEAERDDVKATEPTEPTEEGEREAEDAAAEFQKLYERADPRRSSNHVTRTNT